MNFCILRGFFRRLGRRGGRGGDGPPQSQGRSISATNHINEWKNMFSIGSYHIKNLSHHFNIWIQTTYLKINLFPPGDGVKQIKGNGLGGLSEYYEEWKNWKNLKLYWINLTCAFYTASSSDRNKKGTR